jgi:glucose-6-phosphate dehydrogenase assembly protein OpcA
MEAAVTAQGSVSGEAQRPAPGASGAVSEAVAKVDAQLAAFWAATKDDTGATKARAATMNFVTVSAPSDLDGVRGAIEDLAQTRAGRAFLMTVSPSLAPWELDSDVSSVCHKQGDAVVCYDRIELVFGAMAAGRARSVLSALALSEVPTIVEVGRAAPSSLVDVLARAATRVIVDSAHTNVVRIADMVHKTTAPFADRAFVRTFTWRELVARFFDDAPGAERAIGRVEIERTTNTSCDPAALFLGWLASRLDWRLMSTTRALDAHGMPIEIVVRSAGNLPTGEIAAVRVVTAIDGRPLFCAVEREGADRVVRYRMSGPRTSAHDIPLGYRDEGWVLGKAIDGVEGDRVYRESVLAAAAWAKLVDGVAL